MKKLPIILLCLTCLCACEREIATKAKDYPLCPNCSVRMFEWDKSCPECGSKMDNSSWYSDTK